MRWLTTPMAALATISSSSSSVEPDVATSLALSNILFLLALLGVVSGISFRFFACFWGLVTLPNPWLIHQGSAPR